jgi:hypothetical protein
MPTKKQLNDIKKDLEETNETFVKIANKNGIKSGEGRLRDLATELAQEFGEEFMTKCANRRQINRSIDLKIKKAENIEEVETIIEQLNLLMAKANDKKAELSKL